MGVDVLSGTLVTATAGTTDPNVKHVTFQWKYPNGTIAYKEKDVPVWSNGSRYDGKLIYYATSSFVPTVVGDWGVKALFTGSDVIAQKSTSFNVVSPFNVVPDLPLVGTAGALVTMLFGLGFFLHSKRH